MTSSSASFYVILPSNTNVEGNRTNCFRVRLPRKLQFNSEWYVGLAVIVYPHSWPSLGTSEEQFVNVVWHTGEQLRISVPSTNLQNPKELRETVHKSLMEGSELLVKRLRHAQSLYEKMSSEVRDRAQKIYAEMRESGNITGNVATNETLSEPVQTQKSEDEIFLKIFNEKLAKMDKDIRQIVEISRDLGVEAWLNVYKRPVLACSFQFDSMRNRFAISIDNKFVSRVEISEQLAYVFGFDQQVLAKTSEARFMPDMSGGVSSLHVYAPGLVEPMMVGDVTAPLLRIVTIRGAQDEIVEEQFLAIQYHRLLVKEVSEIQIDIRTSNGVLMPFQYGTCTLTLHFKKASYF